MARKVNLLELYRAAFGYVGLPFPTVFKTVPRTDIPEVEPGITYQRNDHELTSALGSPLFMPVWLNDYQLPNEPIISLRLSKKIVKTEIAGLDGTVKERISNGDYQIVIKGIIVNENTDDYPEEEVRNLRKIIESNDAVKIKCRLTSLFNITDMAIEDFDIPGEPGAMSYQAYTISGSSDRPIELILNDGVNV